MITIAASKREQPNPVNDIEQYRKMRRKKRRRRKLLVFAGVVAVIVVLVFAVNYFELGNIGELGQENTQTQQAGSGGFPKKLFGDHPSQFVASDSLLAMVTDSKLYLYDTSGKTVLEAPHSYTNPVVSCEGNYFLLYDRSGNNFRLTDQSGTVFEQDFSNEIICASVRSDGTSAIASQEERYAGSVTVFSKKGEELFKWYSSNYQVNQVALKSGSNNLAVACIGAQEGKIVSTVALMDIGQGSDQEVKEVQFPDMMILSIRYLSNGGLCVVGDTKTVIVNSSGEIQNEYVYNRYITDFCVDDSGITVLSLASSANAAEHEYIVLGGNADVLGSVVLTEEVKWITAGNGSVYLLTGKQLLCYDQRMNQNNSVEVRSDAKNIVSVGSNVYILGLGEISKAW